MELYGVLALNAIFAFVDQLITFLEELTFLGIPAYIYILFAFIMLGAYKWLISPIFSGGVSAGASDTVSSSVGKAMNNAKRYNEAKRYKERGKWRDK